MRKILNIWAIFWFILGLFVGLLLTQQVYGNFEGCTPTPIPTIIAPCTPTPNIISPIEEITPVKSSPMPSETISNTPTPTPEIQINTPASANNTNSAGQSATVNQPTPTPYYVGPTLMPGVGWK